MIHTRKFIEVNLCATPEPKAVMAIIGTRIVTKEDVLGLTSFEKLAGHKGPILFTAQAVNELMKEYE